jgi:nucleotide-binding universal stress UspA family protein
MSTIVVGHDGSKTSTAAVNEAARLAEALGASLHVVSAYKGSGSSLSHEGGQWNLGGLDQAEQAVLDATSRYRNTIEVTSSVSEGNPAGALVGEAERLDADMIVVGSRRTQGVSRALGSVAAAVVKQSPCSVHIAHTTG